MLWVRIDTQRFIFNPELQRLNGLVGLVVDETFAINVGERSAIPVYIIDIRGNGYVNDDDDIPSFVVVEREYCNYATDNELSEQYKGYRED